MLKEQDEARTSKGEIPFFGAFGLRFIGCECLVDSTDVGGADFDEKDSSAMFCFELCEGSFILCWNIDVSL